MTGRLLPLGLALAAGCSGLSAPTSQTLRALRACGSGEGTVRLRARLKVHSEWLSGTFDAAVAARSGSAPRVRVQIFPDVGGKVLDLMASPDRVVARLSPPAEGFDTAESGWRVHPATLMAATLLEEFAAAEGRVAGQRESPEGTWVVLTPLLPGVKTTLLLGAGGVSRRCFEWNGGPRWEVQRQGDQRLIVRAPGLELEGVIVESQATEALPDSIWEPERPR